MSNKKKGRPKLILIFLFWFEEDLISLYNEFKLEAKSVSDKKEKSKAMRKNCHNLKITVRGILLFCNKMPDKKKEDPTEILSWKTLLKIWPMTQSLNWFLASIKKGLVENEKDPTVTFVRNKYFGKKIGDTLLFPDGYGKETFINNIICMTK